MSPLTKTFVLIILDGWGYRETDKYNAIRNSQTPNWDYLWGHYPHTLISGSGNGVGLPDGQMGNSEVGHLNIGAGRIVYQEYTRVDKAIEDGSFLKNAVLLEALNKAKKNNKAVHILGLLSPGGVHSHEGQILAMLEMAKDHGIKNIYLHAFLDGRDTPPKSALKSIEKIEAEGFQIASLIGRYYAMDRDKRWERTKAAYDLLTLGKADFHAVTASDGLLQAYARGETDEFVKATVIQNKDKNPVIINDDDIVIYMNFRADRARQLTRAFTEKDFTGFERQKITHLAAFVTLTQYAVDINALVAFPPQSLNNVLGEYLSNLGYHQFRIAETEKYAHVTFFFNGGREEPFKGEERLLIPSSKVATYDLHPEMSAPEITKDLVKAIRSQKYGLIVCNYANPDMVGHTGNYDATIKAIETIDDALGQVQSALKEVHGEMIITADHGNAECMYDEQTRQPHTAHTSDPVPLIYVGRPAEIIYHNGSLSDIAPTLLYLMGLPQPPEMSGRKLLRLCN